MRQQFLLPTAILFGTALGWLTASSNLAPLWSQDKKPADGAKQEYPQPAGFQGQLHT